MIHSAQSDGPASAFSALIAVEPELANLCGYVLRPLGFTVVATNDPRELSRRLAAHPQIVLCDLDRGGPLVDRALAAHDGAGVIGVTRLRGAAARLDAFARNVDDIIQLPLDLAELVARTYAVMKRSNGVRISIVPSIEINGLDVSFRTEEVGVNGKALRLTPSERAVLFILAANAGTALSADRIRSVMWEDEIAVDANVIARHVHSVRAKLAENWRTPAVIETVARGGYRYRVPAASSQQVPALVSRRALSDSA